MNLKGICFYGSDVPNEEAPHFIVVLSDTSAEGKVLFVPISSIKFSDNSSYQYKGKFCKYYDSACTLEKNDIIGDDGNPVLTKPSYARYQWAQEIAVSEVLEKQLMATYKYKCQVSDDILRRLQAGAKESDELAPYYSKYFPYF